MAIGLATRCSTGEAANSWTQFGPPARGRLNRCFRRPSHRRPGSYLSTPRTSSEHRCAWADADPILRPYHDLEWGVPEREGRKLWEKLTLDGFQAGLSWTIILRKREAFRRAFRQFDPEKVARFRRADVDRLLQDPGIVRSRAKIEATIAGARAYLAMRRSGLDFSTFVWEFVGGRPIQGRGAIRTQTPLSVKLSDELRDRGFRFVGPVIVYAWMQAAGLVNDHERRCFRRSMVRELGSDTAPSPLGNQR
jgi:DNA-3-methyladenine glycosylase I